MRDIEISLRRALTTTAETFEPVDVAEAERVFLRKRARRHVFRAGGAGILVAASLGAVFVLARPDVVNDREQRPQPSGLQVASRFDVPAEPLAVAAGPSGIWIASREAGVVSRIDTERREIEEIELPGATQVVADGDITWAAGADRIVRFDDATAQAAGEYPGVLIDVPVAPAVDMAVGGRARGGAWAVGPTGCVADLEDLQNRVCIEPDDFHATDVATGPAETWVLDGATGDLHQLHAEPGVNDDRSIVDGEAPLPTAPSGPYADMILTTVGNDALWVSGEGGQLMRLDLVTGDGIMTHLDGDYADLVEGYNSVWALVGHEGTDRGELVAIDVATGQRVGAALPLSGKPSDLAAVQDAVWVTLRDVNQVVQITRPQN